MYFQIPQCQKFRPWLNQLLVMQHLQKQAGALLFQHLEPWFKRSSKCWNEISVCYDCCYYSNKSCFNPAQNILFINLKYIDILCGYFHCTLYDSFEANAKSYLFEKAFVIISCKENFASDILKIIIASVIIFILNLTLRFHLNIVFNIMKYFCSTRCLVRNLI